MNTTLDMTEEACRTWPETDVTPSTGAAYDGCWALSDWGCDGAWTLSGAVGIVVEVDRIGDNPINLLDPSGLDAVDYTDILMPHQWGLHFMHWLGGNMASFGQRHRSPLLVGVGTFAEDGATNVMNVTNPLRGISRAISSAPASVESYMSGPNPLSSYDAVALTLAERVPFLSQIMGGYELATQQSVHSSDWKEGGGLGISGNVQRGCDIYATLVLFGTGFDNNMRSFSMRTPVSKNTVFSGHGEIGPGGGTTIPPGTILRTFSRPGQGISNALGNAIETGQIPAGQFRNVFPSGSTAPSLILKPPGNMGLLGKPVIVTKPVPLSQLLKPNMGTVDWAACTVFQGQARNASIIGIQGPLPPPPLNIGNPLFAVPSFPRNPNQ